MSPLNTDGEARGGNVARSGVEVIGSRIGRKLVYRFLLVGLAPLVFFGVPLHHQTTSFLEENARATLVGQSRLAKTSLFSTLERARHRLEDLVERTETTAPLPAAGAPFRRLLELDAGLAARDGAPLPWPPLDRTRRDFLARGKVVLTAPYLADGVVTLALIAPRRAGHLAAEMDPVELWDLTRAGIYGPDGVFFVLDQAGRLLATSGDRFEPFQAVLDAAATPSRSSGEGEILGLGETIFGQSELRLDGAFGGERWRLIVARSRTGGFQLPLVLMKSLLALLGFSFCAIVLLSFSSVRAILGPILDLAAATRAADWTNRAEAAVAGDDEIADLGVAFNRMMGRLKESREKSVRLTREASVGRLAAMVAHQVNTPLAAIKVKLESLARRAPAAARDLGIVGEQVNRIERIVKALLGFARLRNRSGTRSALHETMRGVEALFRDSFESRGLALELAPAPDEARVACPTDDLQELLVNLLENARDASLQAGARADGRPRAVRIETEIGPERVELRVADEGAGPPTDAGAIFEPFVTSKIHGTGLGLAICRRICETNGGSIACAPRPGGGALFRVVLPRAEEEEENDE